MVFPLLRQSARMTKIVRASLGLPTLRAGSQFQNSKPFFGHLILEFEICL